MSGDIGPCIGSSESSDVHREKTVVILEGDEILLDLLANSTSIGDIVKESSLLRPLASRDSFSCATFCFVMVSNLRQFTRRNDR